jgi:hypothetical protein
MLPFQPTGDNPLEKIYLGEKNDHERNNINHADSQADGIKLNALGVFNAEARATPSKVFMLLK